MSWTATRAVFEVPGLDPSAKFVLVAIAFRAGRDGRAWPSISRLCDDTGFNERTVRRALGRLVDDGHIEVIHRRGRSLMLCVVTPDSVSKTADSVTGTADSVSAHKEEPNKNRSMNRGGGPRPGESWGEYRERCGWGS